MPTPRLNLSLGQFDPLPASRSGVRTFSARFVRAGRIRTADNQPGPIEITPEALSRAVARGLFNGKAVFVDHAGSWENPSLRNLVGVTKDSAWAGDSVEGLIEMYDTPDSQAVADLLTEVLSQGESAPDVGLSIVFYPVWESSPLHERSEWGGAGGGVNRITDIRHIESVDLVFQPAADGRLLQAFSTLQSQSIPKENTPMPEPIQEPIYPVPDPDLDLPPETDPSQAWLHAMAASAARTLIASSGLPQPSRDRLLARFSSLPPSEMGGAGGGFTPADVEQAIESERAYLAALSASQVIQIGGQPPRSANGSITGMRTSLDHLTEALDALLLGLRPQHAAPLSGIREFYHLISGDYEMNGVFQPDRVAFANVNSSTMAALVANALNKMLVNEFQQYPQWWSPIVQVDDFANLQDVRWITLGGVGELPTVAEGAAYTELTWDDKTETASFVKKGGYLGLTIEAIDKDDTARLRAAPRALAQAAWLTLSKAISAIFTSNSGAGPTMSDSQALFHTNHANLRTTALSLTEYQAVRLAMRKQTELNSGERLGALTSPRYLLVPPDLEMTALQVLASEMDYTYALSNGTAAPVNPLASGDGFQQRMNFARSRVIVVDLWTDTNDWAAVADPMLYPTIGLGFRYGRAPEIFSVASPTAGLMFTNDTMPIKARFFFAVGPMDWKGLHKSNVA